MMYHQKFVAVVKVNGKVLRELDDVVTLPFQSEYSLLLKNLDSRTAAVNISIDGNDVLYGSSLIIKPNEEIELLGNLHGSRVTNRFKFIQKTSKIQDHRGDKIDDGIIRIEFAYEKPNLNQSSGYTYHPPGMTWDGSSWTSSTGNPNVRSCENISANVSDEPMATAYYAGSVPQQEEGITVKGSEVNQDFQYDMVGPLEESEVIILRMKGTDGPALTTRSKFKCVTCGTISRSSHKFCPECGTILR